MLERQGWRLGAMLAGAALVGGSLLLSGASAQAASGVNVTSSGGSLRVTAQQQAGKAHRIDVSLVNATFTVTDTGDVLLAGVGCTAVTANTVTCTAAGVDEIVISGAELDDKIVSSAPFDTTVFGQNGNDEITTGVGNDRLDGGNGNDTLTGGAGFDVLLGRNDNDVLLGAEGRDTLDGGFGADAMSGGADLDIADYSSRIAGVTADPDNVADDGEPGEGDNLRGDIEEILGGRGDDVLTGTDDATVQNRLVGNDGNDTLTGLAGIDKLFAGNGKDFLSGGDGNDDLDGGLGPDVVFGGAGRDELFNTIRTERLTIDLDDVADDGATGEGDNVHSDIEDLHGGSGPDLLIGSAANNTLIGGTGDDTLLGLAGADNLFGEGGNDTLDGGDNDDALQGGVDDDTLRGGNGVDRLFGNDGRDFLSGASGFFGGGNDSAPDYLSGGFGVDTADYVDHGPVTVDIDGFADDGGPGEGDNVDTDVENINGSISGDDILIGNDQANGLFGRGGKDTLIGLGGDDTLFGESGDDALNCGAGIDTANGGQGTDSAIACESLSEVP